MLRILSVILILVGFGFPLHSRAGWLSGDDFAIALGGQYSSLLQKRGIITYEGYQAIPVYSIQLWNPRLLVAGSAFYFNQSLFSENHLLRLRLNIDSTNDEPLYYTDEGKGERIRREKTSEVDVYYEFRLEGGSHFRIQYSKDIVEHNGSYTEIYLHLALFNLWGSGKKVLVQPGVFGSLGGGDRKHNEYLYGIGVGQDTQITNVQYGVSVTSPGVIDLFWPTLKFTRFELIGEQVRNASFVQEKDGYQVELLFAFRVL